MIRATNSVLQTVSFVRANSEQLRTADSVSANPDRLKKAPQAPFVSPFIFVDVNFDKAVIQLRNGDTGDVEGQFPSQLALEAQARQEASHPLVSSAPQGQSAEGVSSPSDSVPQASSPAPGEGGNSNANAAAITVQQQAAFQAAAQLGVSNAGNIKLFV